MVTHVGGSKKEALASPDFADLVSNSPWGLFVNSKPEKEGLLLLFPPFLGLSNSSLRDSFRG